MLTRDHVPPSGCVENRKLFVYSAHGHLSHDTDDGRHSEGGLYFDSICAECNERRLGQQYDPELKRFVASVRSAWSSRFELGIQLPNPYSVGCKPQRVARAVIGHLLSAVRPNQIGRQPIDVPAENRMREYFLDPNAPLPSSIRVFCWLYVEPRIVVMRTLGKIIFGRHFVTEILKFPPIAFWVVHEPADLQLVAATDLLPDRTSALDCESLVPIEMMRRIHPMLPEAPGDGDVTFFAGQAGVVAEPRTTKQRRKRGKGRPGPTDSVNS